MEEAFMRYVKTKVTVDGLSLSAVLVIPTDRILPTKSLDTCDQISDPDWSKYG